MCCGISCIHHTDIHQGTVVFLASVDSSGGGDSGDWYGTNHTHRHKDTRVQCLQQVCGGVLRTVTVCAF